MPNAKIIAWRRLVAITGPGLLTGLNFRTATEDSIKARLLELQPPLFAPPLIPAPLFLPPLIPMPLIDPTPIPQPRFAPPRPPQDDARRVRIIPGPQIDGNNIPVELNQQLDDESERIESAEQRIIDNLFPDEEVNEEEIEEEVLEQAQEDLDAQADRISIRTERFNRVNDFKEFRVFVTYDNADDHNLRGLYIAIDKIIEREEDIPYITLFFEDVITHVPRRVTINTQFLDSFEDFENRLAEIARGEVEGSGDIDDDQYDLMIDRFDAIFINPLQANAGTGETFLCEIEKIKPSGLNSCIKDSMKFIGFEIEKVEGEDEPTTIEFLCRYIRKRKLPILILSNKIKLADKPFLKIYDRKKSKFYEVIIKKSIYNKKTKKKETKEIIEKIKLCPLKTEDYEFYMDDTSSDNNMKEEDMRFLVYSRNEQHIAPVKIGLDNNIVKRDDFYISTKKEIYRLNTKNKPVMVLSRKQEVEYMRKGIKGAEGHQIHGPMKESQCEHRYLVIDYETVVDWKKWEVMMPISVSVCDLSQKDMKLLEKYEEEFAKYTKSGEIKNTDFIEADVMDFLGMDGFDGKIGELAENIREMRSKAKTYVGFDCSMKLMKYIDSKAESDDQFQPQYTILTFNGSFFDNIILLNDLLNSNNHMDKVSDIFYTNNMLRNFKIYGRHEMFDLSRHCSGSLAYNCKNYKINVFPKKSFDFVELQRLYNTGELEIMMNNYNKGKSCDYMDSLIKYNDYDVLSLGTLYRFYEKAMMKILKNVEDSMNTLEDNLKNKVHYEVELRDFKTIGSLAYKCMEKYWKNELQLDIPSFIFKKQSIAKKASESLTKKIKRRNYKIQKKNDRYYKYYKDMQAYKTAGRVELFNGIIVYRNRARSLDVTSSYPYSMAINQVYYPVGEMKEIKHYENLPEGKIGFFYCDIDQKVLRERGLPNIIAEKTKIENIWMTKKVLKDYFIPTTMIDQLVKYGLVIGKDLLIYSGVYFTDKIKGCDLFKPLLSAMMTKIEQDNFKEDGLDSYNPALRATVKLFLNCISGKIIERLHVNKVAELKNALAYHKLKENMKIEKLNTINIIGNKIFCSYTEKEQDMMNKHRPIYWGILVYGYSQMNLYDNTLASGYNTLEDDDGNILSLDDRIKAQRKYRKQIFLCDTDACKMSSESAEVCLKRMKKLVVPHWKEAEKFDERLADHKMYNPVSKVFGGFEDEFQIYNNVNVYLAKKHYAGFFDPKEEHVKPLLKDDGSNKKEIEQYNKLVENNEIVTLEFHFKGVSPKALVINTRPFKINKKVFEKRIRTVKGISKKMYLIKSQELAYDYYNNEEIIEQTRISGKRCLDYFERLAESKVLFLLCQSFRKQMSNLKRDTSITDKEKFNKKFNTICLAHSIKAIRCVEKHTNQTEERLVDGVDYKIITCDGEIVNKHGESFYSDEEIEVNDEIKEIQRKLYNWRVWSNYKKNIKLELKEAKYGKEWNKIWKKHYEMKLDKLIPQSYCFGKRLEKSVEGGKKSLKRALFRIDHFKTYIEGEWYNADDRCNWWNVHPTDRKTKQQRIELKKKYKKSIKYVRKELKERVDKLKDYTKKRSKIETHEWLGIGEEDEIDDVGQPITEEDENEEYDIDIDEGSSEESMEDIEECCLTQEQIIHKYEARRDKNIIIIKKFITDVDETIKQLKAEIANYANIDETKMKKEAVDKINKYVKKREKRLVEAYEYKEKQEGMLNRLEHPELIKKEEEEEVDSDSESDDEEPSNSVSVMDAMDDDEDFGNDDDHTNDNNGDYDEFD